MRTLEQLLKMKIDGVSPVTKEKIEYSPSFIIDVQEETEKGVRIIIHPYSENGDTLDFWVKNNLLEQI